MLRHFPVSKLRECEFSKHIVVLYGGYRISTHDIVWWYSVFMLRLEGLFVHCGSVIYCVCWIFLTIE